MKIIACDFDGTLCENRYPNIGAPRMDVINALKKEIANGTKVILWTCRFGQELQNAVDWCKEQGLSFDAINDNLPETLTWMHQNSRKIFASEYWDDKAIVPNFA